MRRFDQRWLMAGVAKEMRRRALIGTYDGRLSSQKRLDDYMALHLPTGTYLIFTRDVGMHSCGWWKNPDYERCWHLSLSFRDPDSHQPAPKDERLTREWIEVFFGHDRTLLWAEPPYSAQGKASDTWHYRLFCDPDWQPILPRGEVYSKVFTERAWKSFSELNDPDATQK